MNSNDIKKTVCQCSNCGNTFNLDELKIVSRKLYNININEKTCPKCGSRSYTRLADVKWLTDKYVETLNKNKYEY